MVNPWIDPRRHTIRSVSVQNEFIQCSCDKTTDIVRLGNTKVEDRQRMTSVFSWGCAGRSNNLVRRCWVVSRVRSVRVRHVWVVIVKHLRHKVWCRVHRGIIRAITSHVAHVCRGPPNIFMLTTATRWIVVGRGGRVRMIALIVADPLRSSRWRRCWCMMCRSSRWWKRRRFAIACAFAPLKAFRVELPTDEVADFFLLQKHWNEVFIQNESSLYISESVPEWMLSLFLLWNVLNVNCEMFLPACSYFYNKNRTYNNWVEDHYL